MSEAVIKVENLSKQYRLGKVGTGTLNHDLKRWWAKVRGQEDPYLKIGSENKRDEKADSDYVWVLRNINFEVKQGEVLGIIGKNGAGKSTLLKILSRVTTPTLGEIKAKGRISSLLEVGTGFHPELSGRENIFLNGAILGMTKQEIKAKYDEIVEFSGVERYLNTPVKRYSSGMYIRLAFGVAAHLEPEILIVDEVLSVGDAEFQKRCLGKMKDVAGQGRTVLFVSHNMSAISALCKSLLVLENGSISHNGDVETGINKYLRMGNLNKGFSGFDDKNLDRKGDRNLGCFTYIETLNDNHQVCSIFQLGGKMIVRLKLKLFTRVNNLEIGFTFKSSKGIYYGGFLNTWEGFKKIKEEGEYDLHIEIPQIHLLPGFYAIVIWLKREGEGIDDQIGDALEFEVVGSDFTGNNCYFEQYNHLGIFTRSTWTLLS